MKPRTANARQPTVESRCHGATISCCVADLSRCLPTTSVTGVQQSTRYRGWDGRLFWTWVAGWLHTEISVRHRELNPDMIEHLSINQARRRLTLSIKANMLTTTPDHQTGYRHILQYSALVGHLIKWIKSGVIWHIISTLQERLQNRYTVL